MTLTEGSLCSGYNGLGLAVEEVLGTELAWYSEIDDAPAAVMAHHYPGVPNLGDLTVVDWTAVPPVDVLTAGYPCQPFSHAGQRKGTNDDRHLWPYIADAIRLLRPRLVILENVAGHLSLGFDAVLGDLASIGFDAEWRVVRASDVGACHQRARLFIVAADAGSSGRPEAAGGASRQEGRLWSGRDDHQPYGDDQAVRSDGGMVEQAAADAEHPGLNGPTVGRGAGEGAGERRLLQPQGRGSEAAADADEFGHERGRGAWNGRPGPSNDGGSSAADADGTGSQGRGAVPSGGGERPAGAGGVAVVADAEVHEQREPSVLGSLRAESWHGDWGGYGPAIERHAAVLGRPAPRPTDARGRLAPEFVEWMQMLPAGWVCDILTSRTKALKCLGNGVVPPQAAYALRTLLMRVPVPA